MCSNPKATNEHGMTQVGAATQWHMSGKSDKANNPRDYKGFDLIEAGIVPDTGEFGGPIDKGVGRSQAPKTSKRPGSQTGRGTKTLLGSQTTTLL